LSLFFRFLSLLQKSFLCAFCVSAVNPSFFYCSSSWASGPPIKQKILVGRASVPALTTGGQGRPPHQLIFLSRDEEDAEKAQRELGTTMHFAKAKFFGENIYYQWISQLF
jgi:hypothetical protein